LYNAFIVSFTGAVLFILTFTSKVVFVIGSYPTDPFPVILSVPFPVVFPGSVTVLLTVIFLCVRIVKVLLYLVLV
jgi:hypothetical protein